MRVGIITKDMPPFHCGIGDHGINLANAIRIAGEKAVIIADKGEVSEGVHVVECGWEYQGLKRLYLELESLGLNHLILQFTPLMYRNEKHRNSHALVDFWERCTHRWKTSIIVHETYFRTWWHPRSWVNGSMEKRLLRKMVGLADFVFSASQPLVDEMQRWSTDSNVHRLPVGSNFPLVSIDRQVARDGFGIQADEIILVLFGGGNSLKWMKKHVYATDTLLHAQGIKAKWLMLGGIPDSWFTLKLPVTSPGRLSEQQVSTWLLASDVFLMPHYAGLCSKRGTLMAAMQHGLPVVGIRTEMTDAFWNNVEGVRLTTRFNTGLFAQYVSDLVVDHQLMTSMGRSNQKYFHSNFTWPMIAQSFLKVIQK